MSLPTLVLVFFLALLISFVCTPLVAKLARKKNWVDIPGGSRAMHKEATPRAGGLAVIAAFLIGLVSLYFTSDHSLIPFDRELAVSQLAFMLGCIGIALIGLYDDAYGLGYKKKFLFQIVIAYMMFLAGYRVGLPNVFDLAEDPYLQAAFSLPITLVWYLAVMNAVNLIDGLDGLAGGVSLIAMVSLAVVFALQGDASLIPVAALMAGALIGFLFYNFNPASIFLGDTGSLFLGFVVASSSIAGLGDANWFLSMIIPVAAIGFPLLDTFVAVCRRLLAGLSPFAPDKDHIHHRMMILTKNSVKGAVLRIYAFQIFLGVAAIALVVVDERYALAVLGGLLLITGAVLRKLGYLDAQAGFDQLRTRLKARFRKPVPRGEWKGDPDAHIAGSQNSMHSGNMTPTAEQKEPSNIILQPVD